MDEVATERRKQPSRSFFNNIKAELNSIKHEATKLGSKDPHRPSISGSYSNTLNLRSSLQSKEPVLDLKLDRKVSLLSSQKKEPATLTKEPNYQSTYDLESRLFKAEARLAQETKRKEEIQYLYEEERRNQHFLKEQINSIKISYGNLEKDLQSKNQ